MNKRNGLLMAKDEKDENSRIKEILPTFTINERNEMLMAKDEKDENSRIKEILRTFTILERKEMLMAKDEKNSTNKISAERKSGRRQKCDLCSAMACPFTTSTLFDHIKAIDFILGSNLINRFLAKKRVVFCSSHIEEFERETLKRYGTRRSVAQVSFILKTWRTATGCDSFPRLGETFEAPPNFVSVEDMLRGEETEGQNFLFSNGADSMKVFETPIVEPLKMIKEDWGMVKIEENQSIDKQISLNRLKEEEKVDVTHLLK